MNQQHHIRTKAIILKKYPQGENDWNITFYSPVLGKAQAIAKGARKINSSKTGHLEPLNLCDLQLYQSSYRLSITECKVQKNFKMLREDFDCSMTATMILEIFQKTTYSSEHCEELFNLLEETLQNLENSGQPMLVVEAFKLKLMEHIGVLPDLQICFSCQSHWQQNQNIWLNDEGHLCCENCISNYPHFFSKIGFEVLKLITYLSQKKLSHHQKITMNKEQKNQLSLVTNLFLNHYIKQEILSEKILAMHITQS